MPKESKDDKSLLDLIIESDRLIEELQNTNNGEFKNAIALIKSQLAKIEAEIQELIKNVK